MANEYLILVDQDLNISVQNTTATVEVRSPALTQSVQVINPTTPASVAVESAGLPGPTGPGVASGGTSGQVLAKTDETDFNTQWSTVSTGRAIADKGTPVVQRAILNFIGNGVEITDNAGTDSSDVTIITGVAGPHDHDADYEATGAVATHEGGTGVHTIAGTTGLQTALDDKLEPIEVLSGANISVDTTTTPGSVIINALGFTVGGMIQSEWVWLAAAHAGGRLPSGRAALASDNPSSPANTTLYIHQEDVPNVDWSFYIQDLDVGWVIYAQQKSDSTSWHRWTVRGTPTLNVDTWEIPVQTLAGSPQGTEPGNNDHIMVGFESPHTMSHSALEDLGLDGAHPQYSLTSHDHAALDIQWGDEPTSPTEGMIWVAVV